jgi:hypothetical protein
VDIYNHSSNICYSKEIIEAITRQNQGTEKYPDE